MSLKLPAAPPTDVEADCGGDKDDTDDTDDTNDDDAAAAACATVRLARACFPRASSTARALVAANQLSSCRNSVRSGRWARSTAIADSGE